MAIGKAENFRVHDEEEFFGASAKRVVSGAMALSANEIDDDASIGDALGTVSITAAYVGVPVWSLLSSGNGQFSIDSSTGVVHVLSGLTGGTTPIRVKVNGVTPPIQATTFSVTVNAAGGGYVAPAFHFDGESFLHAESLTGVVDGPKGIISYWAQDLFANAEGASLGARTVSAGDGNYYTLGNSMLATEPALIAKVGVYLTDESYNSTFDLDVDDYVSSLGVWQHVVMAWDVGFDPGSRRMAIYVDDILKAYTINFDTGDNTFEIKYGGMAVEVGSGFPYWRASLGDLADLYVNYVDTIVEADNTISEVNRRKFITAGGKPSDPIGFPSNGILPLSDSQFHVRKMYLCAMTAAPGPGALSCPGVVIGQTVYMVRSQNLSNVSADFENTISVYDQIQQTAATDYSGETFKITVSGTILAASTSPSD